MAVQIALLRAVNVAGHGKVAMAELRGVFAGLGYAEAQTVLQTGNVIFRSDRLEGRALETQLEQEIAARLGLQTDIVIRGARAWEAMIAANPFPVEAREKPGHLVGLFLKDPVDESAVETLRGSIKGRELVQAGGALLYIVYTDGIGRSKLTNTWIEKRLGTPGTGRNWNTILKIGKAAHDLT